MPTLSKPVNIPGAWAYNGDKNTIPDSGADVGLASWAQGWGPINQLPLTAGGIPPARNDFNGALNALSSHIYYQQSGAYYDWSAELMYPFASRVLGSDGKLYDWVSASGVGTPAGAQDPTTDTAHTYWQPAVTGGDLPEFDGVTIKEINGKYGVPEFTAPTASAPGKAGLVPGPPQITARSIINQFLSGQGWRAITTALLGLDQITQTPVLVPTTQPLGIADANTIPAGVYNSQNWINTPNPNGLLLTIQGIETGDTGYYALQLFLEYGGKVWLRVAQSNEVPGTWPHWQAWALIGTPRPQPGLGGGEWKGYSNQGSGNTITLPAGEVWAYFFTAYNADGSVYGVNGSVRAGGSIISFPSTVKYIEGFTWNLMYS